MSNVATTTHRDPVCGMKVDPETSKHRAEHAGQIFHFCSAGCRTKFVADPEKYLAPKSAPAHAPKGTIYTCPMHPEIVRSEPGSCPICGMALEPDERIAIQKRLVMPASSGFGPESALATSGSSAMPQIGQLPGPV